MLLTGWYHAGGRLVGALPWSPESALRIGFLVVLAVGGFHLFFRWLRVQRAASTATPWRFHWTLAVLGIVASATFVGMSAVGAVHQVSWLAAKRGAVVGVRYGSAFLDVRTIGGAFAQANPQPQERGGENVGGSSLHLFIPAKTAERLRKDYRVYGLLDSGGRPTGVLLIEQWPRSDRASRAYASVGGEVEWMPVSDVLEWRKKQTGQWINLVL